MGDHFRHFRKPGKHMVWLIESYAKDWSFRYRRLMNTVAYSDQSDHRG